MKTHIAGFLSILGMLVAAALPAGAAASPAPAPSTAAVSLAEVSAGVLQDNPELAAARKAWEAAEQAPPQARALSDPKVDLMGMIAPFESWPENGQVTVSQDVPFWGKRSLRGQAAGLEAEVARQAYRAKTLEVLSQTVRAYYELYYLGRTEAILEEQTSVLERLARVADKKYAVGKEPQAMVFRAQAELAALATDLVTAQQEQVSARARLNALLGRLPWSPLGAPEAPPRPASGWDARALGQAALSARPELLALRATQGESAALRRLALRRFFPDFMVGYRYMGAGMSFSGRAAHAGMLGLTLPLWAQRDAAGLREARARQAASRLSAEDLANRTRFEVEDLVVKLETSARLYKLYDDTVLPQAQSALDATQSAYESDSASFLDFMDAERALLRFELEQERHRVDYAEGLAELERVVGGPLPRPRGDKR